ncbi:phosphatidylinositol-binding protein scs2 [Dipodascopsis tothii]|uniref:phosphatidylinositol-binding protein scs2 n=1 Tax=Dipodascopsis tothii TaxID=44089 RepID=UPI0034CD4BA9
MEISPVVLEFSGPFTKMVTRHIQLHNSSAEPIAYKVKTTAPKLYCVRPNASRVNPGETIDVAIILQGLKSEPGPDFKCKDKFLVQTVTIAPEEESMSVLELWSQTEAAGRARIRDQKIKVQYDLSTPVAAAPDATGAAVPAAAGLTKRVPATAAPDAGSIRAEKEKSLASDAKAPITAPGERAAVVTPTKTSSSSSTALIAAAVLLLLAVLLAWLFF